MQTLKQEILYLLLMIKTYVDKWVIALSCNVSKRYSGKGCEPPEVIRIDPIYNSSNILNEDGYLKDAVRRDGK